MKLNRRGFFVSMLSPFAAKALLKSNVGPLVMKYRQPGITSLILSKSQHLLLEQMFKVPMIPFHVTHAAWLKSLKVRRDDASA